MPPDFHLPTVSLIVSYLDKADRDNLSTFPRFPRKSFFVNACHTPLTVFYTRRLWLLAEQRSNRVPFESQTEHIRIDVPAGAHGNHVSAKIVTVEQDSRQGDGTPRLYHDLEP